MEKYITQFQIINDIIKNKNPQNPQKRKDNYCYKCDCRKIFDTNNYH